MPCDRIHPQECGKLPVCTERLFIHENVAVRFLCVARMGNPAHTPRDWALQMKRKPRQRKSIRGSMVTARSKEGTFAHWRGCSIRQKLV